MTMAHLKILRVSIGNQNAYLKETLCYGNVWGREALRP
jgi:hypothetical protein